MYKSDGKTVNSQPQMRGSHEQGGRERRKRDIILAKLQSSHVRVLSTHMLSSASRLHFLPHPIFPQPLQDLAYDMGSGKVGRRGLFNEKM